MSQPTIQTSFASGEWAPKLRSRVDVQKYRSGAALLRNWYVDYSGGGASTRQGTRFINQCKSVGARLIPFQPSSTLSYVLEFGQTYIRFYSNGAPILEAAVAIQSITGSPVTVNSNGNGYANGDWVFISGSYYIVTGAATNSYQLTDLYGNAITALAGTQAQRVYTLTSPYLASDLFPNPATGNPGLKFVQDVTSLIICHPNYAPQILTINSANNWTLATITFAPTIGTPVTTGITAPGYSAGSFNYSFLVTAVDINGQESFVSNSQTINMGLQSATQGAIVTTWDAVPGAVSYNVYKTFAYGTIPTGAVYGFVGNTTSLSFNDPYPGISPDYSQTPPIAQNPFVGSPVASLTLTQNASYTSVPTVTIAAPASGSQATGVATLTCDNVAFAGGGPLQAGDTLVAVNNVVNVVLVATSPFTAEIVYGGSISSGNAPNAAVFMVVGQPQITATFALDWDIGSLLLTSGGSGYLTTPAVTISGSATATATLGTGTAGNPGVPGFLQERLWLANQPKAIQTVNISQPGSFFNFDTSNPAQDDDAITASIISEELNDIRNLTPVPTGMIAFTGKGNWLLNGGGGISTMNPITPANITAQPQAFNGANDLRPIKVGMDVLYGTNKGNYVRDLSYNLYAQIFTGSDISVLSNHLFFGYYVFDWAWAEEPFKTAWAIRNDGQLLSLGYVKEQDLIGWAHHDTSGQFQSVCSVIETVNGGSVVDAVYFIVQRQVNGQTLQYVERMADRYFPFGYEDAWSVDCALQTQPQVSPTGTLTIVGDPSAVGNVVTLTDTVDSPFTNAMVDWVVRAAGGIYEITAFTSASQVTAEVVRVPTFYNSYTSPATAFPVTGGYTIWEPVTTVTGLTQLIGQTVTGVADGAVVPATVVSATGSVTLSTSASKITLGLAYLPQLQTLPLDLGEPRVQGKVKKIAALTLRVADTLGLQAGTTFANAVTMKDFQLGNVPTTSTGPAKVTDLVNGDGRTIIDQAWQEAGNYCIQQNLPYPATVLGAMPEVTVGDTK